MDYNLSEWLNLIVRWIHVFTGILWIGQTFFFTWMDRTLNQEESLWLVHSGGFFIVERLKVSKDLPPTLPWVPGGAAVALLNGMALIVRVFYPVGLLASPPLGGAVTR